jgi:hypothetical protein
MNVQQTIFALSAGAAFVALSSEAQVQPYCLRPVISEKTGQTLYCVRDWHLLPTDDLCGCTAQSLPQSEGSGGSIPINWPDPIKPDDETPDPDDEGEDPDDEDDDPDDEGEDPDDELDDEDDDEPDDEGEDPDDEGDDDGPDDEGDDEGDCQGRGTRDMVRRSKVAGVPVVEVTYG